MNEHEDCQSPLCRRIGFNKDMTELGKCVGYHCVACGLPCGMMGHDCEMAIKAAWATQFGRKGMWI